MLKTLITVAFFFSAIISYAQQCNCSTDTSLSEMVSCYNIHFNNHAKLYRKFNCDSSWLTFESSKGIKTVLYSLDGGLINYTEKLGYQYATEYKSTFLIRNNLISGCCTPPEYILFDKNNGGEIKNIGSLIFYSEQVKYPFVVYLEKKMLNSLKFYDINTKKIFSVLLPANKIMNTLKKGREIHPEYLFEEPTIYKDHFSISFRYQNSGNNDDWHEYKVVVDLKKHGYQ